MDDKGTQPPEFQYLGRKTLWIFVLEQSQATIVVLLISTVLFFVGQSGIVPQQVGNFPLHLQAFAVLGFFVAIIFFLLTFFVAWLTYVNYRYMLGEDSLKIKKGIFNKEEIAIPYRQIQDVSIARSFVYQILGLSRITILTAGQEDKAEAAAGEMEAHGILPAIDKDIAEKLQEELLRRADVEKVVSENQK